MLILKFFIYFALMIVCGVSIIEMPDLFTQLGLLVAVVVSFMMAFSTITEIKEKQ